MRPGATRIACGKAQDSGGHCSADRWCASPAADQTVTESAALAMGFPGDGCGANAQWRPRDFGPLLKRQAAFQRASGRVGYNEIIISPQEWNRGLPWTVEAFTTTPQGGGGARAARERFLRDYPEVPPAEVPLVAFDVNNWLTPFSVLAS